MGSSPMAAPFLCKRRLTALSGWAAAHAGTGYFPIFKEKKLEIPIEKKETDSSCTSWLEKRNRRI